MYVKEKYGRNGNYLLVSVALNCSSDGEYLTRWMLWGSRNSTSRVKIMLHHFHRSDNDVFHDHPWHFEFDCNIQQVKRAEFDHLYYGIFFSDCVVIFHITSEQIGPQIYYSDKQHKGNEGEGQFHLNQDTIAIHEKNYLYRSLTYAELLDLLTA